MERRGNPINATGGYFPPQNLGTAGAARYATITSYDYQKDDQSTVSGDPALQASLGLSAAQIDALYTFVNTQMGNAGLTPFQTGFPSGLGDINGDGTGNGASSGLPAARHLGNVVQVWHPAVNLINPDPNTGSTTQNRIEVFTSNALGQTTTHTDPNGNLTVYVRYPYNDPEGNGGATARGTFGQAVRPRERGPCRRQSGRRALAGGQRRRPRGLRPRPHGNYPLQLAGRVPGPGHPL